MSLVLDIPNGMLDPQGYSDVEVRLHTPTGDRSLTANVSNNAFDLGTIDAMPDTAIEAWLRTSTGTTVGYGRSAVPSDLKDNVTVTVPVRRPIIYFSGFISDDPNPSANNDRTWMKTKPTFYDLTSKTSFDGTTQLATNAFFTVGAGPNLFTIDQTPTSPSDALVLTGNPSIKTISTTDHSVGMTPLGVTLDGGVQDAAGTDDGTQLVVATTLHLYVVDTVAGTAKPIADGNFSRVAIVTAGARAVTAIAIRNRPTGTTCSATADLVWAAANADDTNQVMTLATSGYTDVAADAGRGFYVDGCKTGELGEATAAGTQLIRGALGRPTALAVGNGTAWVGLEKGTSLAVQGVALTGSETPRTVFEDSPRQVVESLDFPGVLRRLDSDALAFLHLEVGAGGDYIAWTVNADYHGSRISGTNIPEMFMRTQELRVLDTSTGGLVQNYRSICEGRIVVQSIDDLTDWACSLSPGQVEAPTAGYDHFISAMTFQFGKK